MPNEEVAVDCQCDQCKGRRGEESKQRKPSGKFQDVPTQPNATPPPPPPPQSQPAKAGKFADVDVSKASKSHDPPQTSRKFADVEKQPQKPPNAPNPPRKFADVEKAKEKAEEPKQIAPKFADVATQSTTTENVLPKKKFGDFSGHLSKADPATPKPVPMKFVDADGSSAKKQEDPPKKQRFDDAPSKPAADSSPKDVKAKFGDASAQQSPKSDGDASKSGGILQSTISKLWDSATKLAGSSSPKPAPKFGDAAPQPTMPPEKSAKFGDVATQSSGNVSERKEPEKKFADVSSTPSESVAKLSHKTSTFSNASSQPQPTAPPNVSKFADAPYSSLSLSAGPIAQSNSPKKPAPWTDVTADNSITAWPSQQLGSALTPAEEMVGRTVIQANAASLDAAKRLIAIAENDKLPPSIRQSAAKAFERTMEGHVSTLGLIDYIKEVYRRRMSQSSNGDRPNIYEFALFAATAIFAVRVILLFLRPKKALPASQYYY
ncbi:hypothetical protein BJ742DRAFT_786126 [Cladochytrium replicatum]|nr:hypothetical protein BJ742DRAFT_786126 [Cladochytrium replicatum]